MMKTPRKGSFLPIIEKSICVLPMKMLYATSFRLQSFFFSGIGSMGKVGIVSLETGK
jgi:hypothetical protein